MRKNYLYYMFAVICSVCLFAACSDDDDDEDNASGISDIIGTYTGEMDITMASVELVSNEGSSIEVTKIDDENVNIAWSGTLELYGTEIPLTVDCDCSATLSGDEYILTGTTTTDITALGYTGLEVTVSGEADATELDLYITVPTLYVVVDFEGTK